MDRSVAQKKILFGTVFLVLIIRCLYIFSFPFDFGADASMYYTMILQKHSHMLMAQGYPFLMMFPYHFLRQLVSLFVSIPDDSLFNPWWTTSNHWLVGSQTLDDGISWVAVFQNHDFIIFQHSIELLTLLCGFILVRKYFGFWVSVVFLVLYGISPSSLEDSSACRPEWFQGSLFVFWVYLAEKIKEASFSKKLVLYGALGLLCAAGFLVKFNGLPIFLVLFALLIFWDRELLSVRTLWKTLAKVSICGLLAIGLVWVFIAGYHRPTTGSSTLTVNSWILADKAFQFLPTLNLSKENGIHAKRVLALKRGLPLTKGVVLDGTYFRKPGLLEELRAPYREKLGWILNATSRELDQYLSSVGTDSLYEQQSLLHFAYYIGLEEYGDLLKKMYIESVKKYPLSFFHDTAIGFLRSFAMKQRSNLYHALYEEVQAGRNHPEVSHYGFVKFLWPSDRGVCYHENVVWLPGVWLFTKMSAYWPPTWFVWFLAFFAFFSAVKNVGKDGMRSSLIVGITLILLLFVFGSNMLYIEFRIKDYRCIHLFATALASIGLYQIFNLGKEALRRSRYRSTINGLKVNYG
ncbi:MAG TPA: hypothetical protein VLE95_04330 [Chlamydiales bacterium]|nr:hypothetical protein [Chlamydiales bacterium]